MRAYQLKGLSLFKIIFFFINYAFIIILEVPYWK